MILPPLPEPLCHADGNYTSEQMCKYALLAIKTVCGAGKRGVAKKFNDAQVYQIRDMQQNGLGYKEVNRTYPMSRELYFRIIGRKGAYK